VLPAHKLAQDAQRDRWGGAYADHGLVFAREDRTPLYGDEATKRFGQLCDEAGVRRVRLHDLRHGAASLRLAAGVDIAIVSKILGHSSVAITADTYSHLLEGVGREAAERAMSLVPRTARDSRETGGLPSGSRSPEDDHERSAETGNTRWERVLVGAASGNRTRDLRITRSS
jgi:hypothetical protein